jgi:sigma-B regulation protein RsbU (phosphoserine phosphatase)
MSASPAIATTSDEPGRLAAVRRYAILDTPPDGAFDRVCALAARFFDVPFASVTIVDEDRIWFKAALGLGASEIPRSPGLCGSAILHSEPYLLTDCTADPRSADNPLVTGELGVRFYAAAPIVTSDGHRLGTVNVIDIKPRETTEEEMRTLTELAAIVMDELELRLSAIREVQREQALREQALREQGRAEALARTLQRTLSPSRLPHITGLEVAAHYEPYAAEEVGGDFYDLFPLTSDRAGFFLGDVCGKGPEAAGVTSLARYTIRAAALLSDGPAEILANLNTALLLEGQGDGTMRLCTAVYGEIDTSTPEAALSIGVAGHPAPLIVRADGSVESTTAHGTILGVYSDARFDMTRSHLAAGDAIVIYSDGLLDVEIDGRRVEEEEIRRLLQGPPGAGAQALVDRLRGALLGIDRRLRDDVAIMALRRAP